MNMSKLKDHIHKTQITLPGPTTLLHSIQRPVQL